MSQYKAYTSLKKVKWVGKDQFIIHKRELLESESWKTMSINCFRLINYLELCYLSTGGEENGNLIATYNQLEKYGIRRHSIKDSVEEAKNKGLITYKISEKVGKYGKYTFQFGLTYLPLVLEDNKRKTYIMPSNEWKKFQKGSDGSDTYISDGNDTYYELKHIKNSDFISDGSDTTIYILGDNKQNDRSAVNE